MLGNGPSSCATPRHCALVRRSIEDGRPLPGYTDATRGGGGKGWGAADGGSPLSNELALATALMTAKQQQQQASLLAMHAAPLPMQPFHMLPPMAAPPALLPYPAAAVTSEPWRGAPPHGAHGGPAHHVPPCYPPHHAAHGPPAPPAWAGAPHSPIRGGYTAAFNPVYEDRRSWGPAQAQAMPRSSDRSSRMSRVGLGGLVYDRVAKSSRPESRALQQYLARLQHSPGRSRERHHKHQHEQQQRLHRGQGGGEGAAKDGHGKGRYLRLSALGPAEEKALLKAMQAKHRRNTAPGPGKGLDSDELALLIK